MWSLGDYSEVAPHLESCAVALADACAIRPGMAVLDVAAGNGNFAIAAARRGARVTATDLTPRMLELGRERTRALGFDVEWNEGDAENLPLADGGFDVVASVFGAMFAQQPHAVAAEMFRVCCDGGLVAMANYTGDGFLGSTSRLFAKYSNPLPFALPSPFEWGEPAVVAQRFEGLASDLDLRPRSLTMRFDSINLAVEFWERTNAPMQALRATAPAERYAECRTELRRLMETMNASPGGGVELSSAYLEVLARK